MMDNVCPQMFSAPEWSLRQEIERVLEPHFRDLGWVGRSSGLARLRELAIDDSLEARSTGVLGSFPGVEGAGNYCDDLTQWLDDGYGGEYMVDHDLDCDLDDE